MSNDESEDKKSIKNESHSEEYMNEKKVESKKRIIQMKRMEIINLKKMKISIMKKQKSRKKRN
jgi:hypothetical protein